MIRKLILSILFIASFASLGMAETVTFKASDGVVITADTGGTGIGAVIVLYHMAKASRGEYRDIAPRLHKLGYRTLAVDQRSGGAFNGVRNETAKRVGRNPGFQAALPDIMAAAEYARKNMKAKKVGALGSSYSSSLVLVAAGQNKTFANAVMSFSPGEYFANKNYVRGSAAKIKAPVFITAARSEMGQITPIAKAVKSDVTLFKPQKAGRHGATALNTKAGPEYWTALEAFLAKHLPAR